MPTLADIQAAIPRCCHLPQRTFAGLSTPPVPQCLNLLHYLRAENAWHCNACNHMYDGQTLGQRILHALDATPSPHSHSPAPVQGT